MKKTGFFRALSVALTLALLLVTIPATVAMAAVTIEVENVEGSESTNPYWEEAVGEIGDDIHISGSGTAGQELHICISNQNVAIDDDIDDEVTTYEWVADPSVNALTSNYTANAVIPDTLNDGDDDLDSMYGGTYYFYVTSGSSKNIIAKAEFYITGIADAEIDEEEGPVGSQVEITGEGFAPEEEIVILFEGEDITDDYVLEGDIEVDDDGEFEVLVEIPEEEYGEHDLVVRGSVSLGEIEFVFTIIPEITLDPASGEAGAQVLVNGTGFDGRNYVDIYIGSTFIMKSDNRTSSSGSFTQSITIPADSGNRRLYDKSVEDEDDDDIYAGATFSP